MIPFQGSIYNLGIGRELATLWELIGIYRRYRFDLALHYTIKPNIYGAFAALWSGTPSVSITTGLGILKQHPSGVLSWLIRRLYQAAVRITREIWFLNEADRDFFLSKKMAPRSKAFLLRGEGVDVRHYHPREEADQTMAPSVFRVLYLGRMLKSKGLEELYAAAQFFKEKKLPVQIDLLGFFIGDHPDGISRETIKAWEAAGNLRYLGAVEDVRPYLAATDAVVLPSYGEGMSRSLMEACSMAKPVIASDVEGCREIVHHEVNGLLCTPRNSRSLLDAILRMYALSETERRSMGLAGRSLVLCHFTEQSVLEQYEQRIGLRARKPAPVATEPLLPVYIPASHPASR
ncbi:MAG: glycosyltransferase family 4 protein [Haliscomenobacter sp.]|nr:glycosyltransferase family 4 protein [Haliscomenobacter sp.]